MESGQINNAEADFLSLYEQAENGNPDAQYQLGLCFLNGMGIRQDTQLAEVWLLKAASANHPEAIRDLQWIHEASLLDIDRLKQRLAEQAQQKSVEVPVPQPDPQPVIPVPVPIPEPEPEPEPEPLPPLPDYLLVPEYVPTLPRKAFETRAVQPGGVISGTQYLIEGHPAPAENQSTSYIASAAYVEPEPPYVPQLEEVAGGGVPSGTEYMLTLPYGFEPVEDTVIDRENPGFIDRLILGFKNHRYHRYGTILGCIFAFIIVIGVAHAIGKFDKLLGSHSELKDATNVIHIHDGKRAPVGINKNDVNDMVTDIMDSSYGRFDAKLGCWASRSGGTEYCIKVNRVDAVKTAEGSRVYVLATGRMANENTLADGVIGMFVLEPQSSFNYTIVAKNPFVTAGTGDEPPENWRFVKLGKNDVWGWQGEIENNNLGETDSGVVFFTQIDGNIKNVGYIPTALEMLNLTRFNGHLADAHHAIDLKGDITIEDRAGGQYALYPIRLTVSGIRYGSNIKDESIIITFKEDLGEYVIPTRNPFTH